MNPSRNGCVFFSFGERDPYDFVSRQLAAISAIDEVLQQRGHVSLILGQPLEVVERSSTASLPLPPKKKAKAPAQEQTSRTSGPSTVVPPASTPRPQTQSNAVAGPSKRPPSPAPAPPPQKKSRQSLSQACMICGLSPHHLAKDCGVVSQGSKR